MPKMDYKFYICQGAEKYIRLMYFCTKSLLFYSKILDAVNLGEEFVLVKEKMEAVILPGYVCTPSSTKRSFYGNENQAKMTTLLKNSMPKMLLKGNKEEVSFLIRL